MSVKDIERFKLRQYQEESRQEIVSFFESEWGEEQSDYFHMPMLLVLPTGTGKTRTAASICISLLESKIVDNVIWIAKNWELIKQARESIQDMAAIDRSKEDEEKIINSFRYSTNMSFCNSTNTISKISDKTLVVYDEAHHCTADSYMLETVKQKGAKILGLTATPFRYSQPCDKEPFVRAFVRTDNDQSWSQITQRVKRSIVERFTSKDYKEYLCEYKNGIASVIESRKQYVENNGEITDWDSSLNWLTYFITDTVLQNKNPKGKVLIFARQNLAEDIYNRLIENENRIKAGLMLSDNIKKGRADINRFDLIEAFDKENYKENGEEYKDAVEILINNQILTEGFDQPKITDIILLYNTESPILMTQIIGRGLRKCDEIENKICNIYPIMCHDFSSKEYRGPIENIDKTYRAEAIGWIESAYKQKFCFDNGKVTEYINRAWYRLMIGLYSDPERTCSKIRGVLLKDGDPELYITDHEINALREYVRNEDTELPFYFPSISYKKDEYKNVITEQPDLDYIEYLEWEGLYKSISQDNDTSVGDEERCLGEIRENLSGMLEKLEETPKKTVSAVMDEVIGEADPIKRCFYTYELIINFLQGIPESDITTQYDEWIELLNSHETELVECFTEMFDSIDNPMKFFIKLPEESVISYADYEKEMRDDIDVNMYINGEIKQLALRDCVVEKLKKYPPADGRNPEIKYIKSTTYHTWSPRVKCYPCENYRGGTEWIDIFYQGYEHGLRERNAEDESGNIKVYENQYLTIMAHLFSFLDAFEKDNEFFGKIYDLKDDNTIESISIRDCIESILYSDLNNKDNLENNRELWKQLVEHSVGLNTDFSETADSIYEGLLSRVKSKRESAISNHYYSDLYRQLSINKVDSQYHRVDLVEDIKGKIEECVSNVNGISSDEKRRLIALYYHWIWDTNSSLTSSI